MTKEEALRNDEFDGKLKEMVEHSSRRLSAVLLNGDDGGELRGGGASHFHRVMAEEEAFRAECP